jgi:hypothetical protein
MTNTEELQFKDLVIKSTLRWEDAERERKLKKLQNKINQINYKISRYFYEVVSNFEQWKDWMSKSNEEVEKIYNTKSITGHYPLMGFNPYYFGRNGRHRTSWDVYSKLAENPTMTEFINFMENWKGGVEKPVTNYNDIFNFNKMFL